MARASYLGSARAMALGTPPLAWFCAATWPVFTPPLTIMNLQKKILFALLFVLGTFGLASALYAQTWQKVAPSGGASASCSYRQNLPVYSRVAPTQTTLQYVIIGGGAGASSNDPGGDGTDTTISVNGVTQATATGGSGDGTPGTQVQGSLTISEGDLLEIKLGGGGGGGGQNSGIGDDAPDSAIGTIGSSQGGGGGGYGSGGGSGYDNYCCNGEGGSYGGDGGGYDGGFGVQRALV